VAGRLSAEATLADRIYSKFAGAVQNAYKMYPKS